MIPGKQNNSIGRIKDPLHEDSDFGIAPASCITLGTLWEPFQAPDAPRIQPELPSLNSNTEKPQELSNEAWIVKRRSR